MLSVDGFHIVSRVFDDRLVGLSTRGDRFDDIRRPIGQINDQRAEQDWKGRVSIPCGNHASLRIAAPTRAWFPMQFLPA